MQYFKRKLDDKNRLTIPAEVRSEFTEGIVITPGFADYLHVYPQKIWQTEMQAALAGSWLGEGAKPAIINQELADLADQLQEGMVEATLDAKQGRITLDNDLLKYAGIDSGGEVAATRMPGGYWRLKRPQR
jgi:DNA-binding transcriptional regulator/RsmH inhibitor MraZ